MEPETESEPADKPDGGGNTQTVETIAAEGKRIVIMFGTGWYTGLVVKVYDNGNRIVAFDDGDIR